MDTEKFKILVQSWYFWSFLTIIIVAIIYFGRKGISQFFATLRVKGGKLESHDLAAIQQESAVPESKKAAEDRISKLEQFNNGYIKLIEDNLREDLKKDGLTERDPESTIKVLIKYNAAWSVLYAFETIYNSIWGSQIKILLQLNTVQNLKEDDVKIHYELAKIAWPFVFASYQFDGYLNFLIQKELIEKNSNILSLTLKGKTFLTYLVQSGKSLDKNY